MSKSSSVDAIVIGAGHNGVVAANLLADAGWQVLVLEATDHPAEPCTPMSPCTPGSSPTCTGRSILSGRRRPILQALELDQYGLRWTHAPTVFAHVWPDLVDRWDRLNQSPQTGFPMTPRHTVCGLAT
jgi:phytoene dehydrogenase-like protein